MAEVPTLEIHSPKDALQKWIINEDDFDPAKHRLWGHVQDDEPIGIDSEGNEFTQSQLATATIHRVEEMVTVPIPGPEVHRNVPSVPDYVQDDSGETVAVNIIDPDRRTSRKEIPMSDYDPDTHELWSTHPRFNR